MLLWMSGSKIVGVLSMEKRTTTAKMPPNGSVLNTSFVNTEEMTLPWKRFVNASTVRRFSVLLVPLLRRSVQFHPSHAAHQRL